MAAAVLSAPVVASAAACERRDSGGGGNRAAARRPHAMVARGAIRDVHPLGPLRGPAGEWKGRRSNGGRRVDHVVGEHPARPTTRRSRRSSTRSQFDAAEWVRIAKDAGMKYIVITSKHHDGFAMFDSAVSDYDIVDAHALQARPDARRSPTKRSGRASCSASTTRSWTGTIRRSTSDSAGQGSHGRPRQDQMRAGRRRPAYVAYMKAQLEELVTRYDPAVLWFDGEWVDWWTEAGRQGSLRLRPRPEAVDHRQQPRRQGPRRHARPEQGPTSTWAGDFGTPEQEIPADRPPRPRLGKLHDDERHLGLQVVRRSTGRRRRRLMRKLVDVASKGGNYLLNVGPTARA